MVIYIDVSSAVHSKAGLARYAESLVGALAPILGERLRLFQNGLGQVGPLPGWEATTIRGVRQGYRTWRTRVLLQQVLRLPMDRLVPEAELFHATEHLLPRFETTPTVLTVHDLIFERFPAYHKLKNYAYLKLAMPLYCRRASAIITVSQCTKNDLVGLYSVPADKITVIPEAADVRFGPRDEGAIERVRIRYGLPERYILAVGTIEPRKNLGRLADACGPIFAEGLADALVLVGSKGWLYEGFFQTVEDLEWKERVILPGYVEDADLAAVYSGAMVTAQPSLYEGFGLPMLEAMACGCPVCASNVSSLPEVGGDAALYFEPTDTASITEVLRRILSDADLRQELEERGLARALAFSWERTARLTLALYEQVMQTGVA